MWNTEVTKIEFDPKWMNKSIKTGLIHIEGKQFEHPRNAVEYDELIFAVGKSGIDFGKQLADDYNLPTEPKSVQIGVRFESPQKYFQKLIDVSYDFKLYQKFDNVSLRSFCTNNNAAYVAPEITYGDVTFNGHAFKEDSKTNNMTNFGILMEIKGIENPFEWSRNVIKKCQVDGKGIYYSPSRKPSLTSEGAPMPCHQVDSLDIFKESYGEYAQYIINFIENMKSIFPDLKDDWGMYIGEVKYLSPEPLVKYDNLSLIDYSNIYFAGDALSARGITVAGSQGIYIAEYLLKNA
jgi:uncharacterized FAD-dependent dehydrogenase